MAPKKAKPGKARPTQPRPVKPKYIGPSGPVHKTLSKEDLQLFENRLMHNHEHLLSLEASLQRLADFLNGIKTHGLLSTLIDPLKRDIRQSMTLLHSSSTTVQSQRDLASALIEEGRIGETLTALNSGQITIMDLIVRINQLRDHVYDVPSKAGMALSNLQDLNYESEADACKAEIEAWQTGLK